MDRPAPRAFNPEAEPAAPPAAWRDLGLGVHVKLRPDSGLLAASIQAQISRDLYDFHAGQQVVGRYGFGEDEAGLLSEPQIAMGFGLFLDSAVRGAALIEDWNLESAPGEPVPVTLESVTALFHKGVGPGTGGLLMSAFRRACDVTAADRVAEGNVSAPLPNGATAGESPSVEAAAKRAPPAPAANGSPASSARKSSTPRTRRRASQP